MARPKNSHYSQEKRAQEFLKLVERKATGCHEWIGSKFQSGYGAVNWAGKKWRAHRLSYTLFVGPIPSEGQVLHRCDNPKCVNPNHLFLGDPKANAQDRTKKGRNNAECGERRHSSKLDESKVRAIRQLFHSGKAAAELGRLYQVSASSIQRIVLRQSWKHVT
jgi:hypothetical protein